MPRRLQKQLSLAIFFSTCSLFNLAAVYHDGETLLVCVYGDQTGAEEDLFPREVTSQSCYQHRSTNSGSGVFTANYGTSAIIYSRIVFSILFHKTLSRMR